MRLHWCLTAALIPASMGRLATAQAPTADKAAPPAAAAPDAKSPAAAEYQRLFEEWKSVLKELRSLKVQFQSAPLAEQATIKEQWDAAIAKGNQTVAALEAAGLKAYAEAPNEDPQLARLLVKLADDCIQRDEYEAAKRITDVLIENQWPDKQLYDTAAIAAYVLNDYDQAEKYFQLA